MLNQDIRQRFDEMLPWYVNGTLEQESRQWFEGQLSAHPELRSELSFTEALRDRVQAAVPTLAPDIGLDTLMRRINSERQSSQAPRARIETPTLRERIANFLEGFRFSPAFATAAAVIAVQAGVIGALVVGQSTDESEYATFRSSGDGQIVSGPLLEVAFSADARERDIRGVLVRVGGMLAGGPGQFGNYVVYVPADRIAEAARILESDPAVEAVSIIPASEPGR